MNRASSTLPTIGDIARRVGIFTATVSRVVNQPDSVRENPRSKVGAAISRLDYIANGGGRSL